MASGLRLWDKATNIEIITTSTAICMPFALIQIGGDGAAQSGSYANDNLTRGIPRAQLLQVGVGTNTTNKFVGAAPTLTISGSTLYWQFQANAGANPPVCRILLSVR
ncbi:MAG: hypothetical protein EOO61_03060 [Hymenobacter sp.]|nr:MAG: hypothetical protein EOO61_03060 [Hymenobacter sp.]